MPWCPRCATGHLQHEIVTEGYQEITHTAVYVKLPAARPARRVAAGLDDHALDADGQRRRRGPPRPDLSSRCARGRTCSTWPRAPPSRPGRRHEVLEELPGSAMVGWRYRGPFDELPAVRRRRRQRTGSSLGRGHRGRGHGHRPHRAGLRRGGLRAGQAQRPAGHRAARRDRHLPARLRLADRPVRRGRPGRSSAAPARRRACSTAPSPTPTAIRSAGAAAPSSSSAWSTSGSSAWTELRARPLDGRHARKIRWIPELRPGARAGLAAQHGRLDDLEEALLGPGAADLDLRRPAASSRSSAARTSCRSAPSRAGTSSRATRRIGPGSTRSRSPARSAARTRRRIPDVGNPWLDAGIVPFSTLDYRNDRAYWAAVVPGRLHHRELPRPVPQLVLLAAGDEHRARGPRAVPDRARLRARCATSRATRCTSAGATRSSSTRRPTASAPTSCAGSSPGEPGGQPQLRLQRRRRGQAPAADAVEHLHLLRHLRPPRRLRPDRRSAPTGAARPALDRWVLSRAEHAGRPTADRGSTTSTR